MMITKVRREYLLRELNHRLKELQKDLKNKFGIAQLKDGVVMLCALASCDDCVHFDGHYKCKTQECLDLASLITTLEDSKEECVEIDENDGMWVEF